MIDCYPVIFFKKLSQIVSKSDYGILNLSRLGIFKALRSVCMVDQYLIILSSVSIVRSMEARSCPFNSSLDTLVVLSIT